MYEDFIKKYAREFLESVNIYEYHLNKCVSEFLASTDQDTALLQFALCLMGDGGPDNGSVGAILVAA